MNIISNCYIIDIEHYVRIDNLRDSILRKHSYFVPAGEKSSKHESNLLFMILDNKR